MLFRSHIHKAKPYLSGRYAVGVAYTEKVIHLYMYMNGFFTEKELDELLAALEKPTFEHYEAQLGGQYYDQLDPERTPFLKFTLVDKSLHKTVAQYYRETIPTITK